MRLLIYEPDYRGHRLQYVRMLVEAFAPLAGDVVVALGKAAPQSDEFRTHLSPVADAVQIDTVSEIRGNHPLKVAMQKVHTFRQVVVRHKPDHVCVPYADGLAQVLGLARLTGMAPPGREVEIEGLIMRGNFAYRGRGWREGLSAKLWLKATQLAPLRITHWIDPIAFEEIRRSGGSLAARSLLIPEPVEAIEEMDRGLARRRLGIPDDGRYIGCCGTLSQRKGIDRLIAAFADAKLRPTDRLLLVGRADADIRAMLSGPFAELVRKERLIVVDRYVSQEQLHTGLRALDVICIPYVRHYGPSGIVVRAAAAGRPILGIDYGWVGMVTARLGLGTTCNVLDAPCFSAAIRSALDGAEYFRFSEAGRRFTQYHTADNFAAHWTMRLRARLGLPPAKRIPWDWVMEVADSDPHKAA